jgi:hypothetical protein
MKSPLCDMLGIEFPLFAFSHCRDVVAAVSRAGGFGVFGATSHSPETVEQELKWIDDHVDGKPYGIDVLIPENMSTAGEKDVTWKSLEARIPVQHREYTKDLLKKYGIELQTSTSPTIKPSHSTPNARWKCWKFPQPSDRVDRERAGAPPKEMLEMGRARRARCRSAAP